MKKCFRRAPEHFLIDVYLFPIENRKDVLGELQTIVLSGHITEEAALELSEMNQVLAIMAKPWNGEDLLQLISQQLNISRLPQPLNSES